MPRFSFITALTILGFIFIMFPAHAQEEEGIVIEAPYSYATAPTAKNGAVFMVVKNYSDAYDRIIDVHTDVAEINELHEMFSDPDTHHMMMRKVRDGIPVPAREGIALVPGGFHIMLIKLHEPLKEGDAFPLTITFEKAGEITVDAVITAPGKKAETQTKRDVIENPEKALSEEGYKYY